MRGSLGDSKTSRGSFSNLDIDLDLDLDIDLLDASSLAQNLRLQRSFSRMQAYSCLG